MQIEPLGLVLMAIGCFGWLYAGYIKRRAASDKMKRRPLPAGASGSMRHAPSQALAEDYRDSARQNQDRPLISEDGQPARPRVGLPRSRRP